MDRTPYERVQDHMLRMYRKKMEELEITDVPGYWKDKHPCKGAGACRHPMHAVMFCEAGTRHTYRFRENDRDSNGRFMRPFRAWEELRNINKEQK